MIEEIKKMVEVACRSKNNYFGYSAWSHHIKFVVRDAKLLAEKLEADIEIVEIAALLHDYSCIVSKEYYKEHHIHSARMAEEILMRYKYPKRKIEQVKHCILAHRGSRADAKDTIEAQIVASADAMAHFENLNDLLYLAFVIHKMGVDGGTEWVMKKLERSWKKLMPEAREIIKPYFEAIKLIMENDD